MRKLLLVLVLASFAQWVSAQSRPEGLFIGSKAKDFKAKDQNKQDIRLKDLLKKGKVVLVFYRGYWCPYCNRHLSALQDSLSFITEKGATLVAITPEKPENVDKTVEKTKASFSIIHDEGMKIMKDYDVAFEMQENVVTRYRNSGLDMQKINGANGNNLPVPAVYIIGDEQTITYRFFEPDYKKRPSVKEILENL